MDEIGGKPILWHIMRHYAHFGHSEFVIALGYKGEVIKRFMVDYAALQQQPEGQLAHGRHLHERRVSAGLDG
ncbi:MAG: hypothetical protein R2851_28585 [Caldilineaceae bacterium]